MTSSRTRVARSLLGTAAVALIFPHCGQRGAAPAPAAAGAPTASGGGANAARGDAAVVAANVSANCVGHCTLHHHAHDAGEPPEGTVDLDAVEATLRREAQTLRTCFDRARARRPHLAGQLEVTFTIGTDGRVVGAPDASGLHEAPEVGTCIASRVRYITFPRPVGGAVEVSFPFVVEPGT